MINNRQNGRRRGRGGGQRSPNNVPNPGNRQDNRQRGNAAQLHEKYKALARDAQLSGDRVQTEFYLQFADHYFRVLNEGRARFEEQRRQRGDFGQDEEDQDEVYGAGEQGEQLEREERPARFDNQRYQNGRGRDDGRGDNGRARDEDREPMREQATERAEQPDADEERISLDVLPPAIAADGDAPRAPRARRPRRPRSDEGDEIAPAA